MTSSDSRNQVVPASGDWYLVRTKSRQETRAEHNLRRQSYHCFYPRIEVQKIRRGQRIACEEALFPGYLFLFMGESDSWRPIRSTFGVQNIVVFGGRPLSVPWDVVEQLKRSEVYKAHSRDVLVQGDKLSIVHGPFVNLNAVFKSFDGEGRVVVLLDFLQQQQSIKLPLSDIRLA